MVVHRSHLAARRVGAVMACALGLVAAASTVQAQVHTKTGQATSGAQGARAADMDSVTVHAPRRHPRHSYAIAPNGAIAAEAARQEAWRTYRDSPPSRSSDPMDQTKDYPGLHTLLPK